MTYAYAPPFVDPKRHRVTRADCEGKSVTLVGLCDWSPSAMAYVAEDATITEIIADWHTEIHLRDL